MAASPASSPASHSSKLVTLLVVAVLILVAALVAAGYWLQKQRDQEAQRAQAQVYQNYLRATHTPEPAPAQAPSTAHQLSEAQATRQYLLDHPAVTPGSGFDQPHVQATGKAILQAIDQAQGI